MGLFDKIKDAVTTDDAERAAQAKEVADHLIAANLAGHDSHGVGMLPDYARRFRAGLLLANQELATVRESGAVLVLDGRRGYGQVMAAEAMRLVADDVQGVVLAGSGHWVAEQAPDQLLAALTKFLAPYREGALATA